MARTDLDVFGVLETVESTQGTNAKLDVVSVNRDVPFLSDFFRLAEDPTLDFGVKKLPKFHVGKSTDTVLVGEFIALLEERLATRKLSGNAARDAVVSILSQMTAVHQKWCTRLLLRNLRCGVSGKLVERVWPGLVKPYKVLLATAVPVDSDNIPVGVVFPCLGEPKLDGLRCIAEKRSGKVVLRTRNGNPINTLPTVVAALESCPQDGFILDGEAMVARTDDMSWNDSASVLMSHVNVKSDAEMTYNVFDAMYIEHWDARECPGMLHERLEHRTDIVVSVDRECIRAVASKWLESMDDLLKFNDECLEAGYEGIMIKDPNGRYEWRRVKTSVMKYKPVQTYEGVIVGWYDGGIGTKNEDRFGGFHVLMENGVTTKVGGGFSDALRGEINKDPDSYIGCVAEVEGARGFARNGCVRFPEFIRFRDPGDVDPVIFEVLEAWSAKERP